jgi:cobalt-zinc-cadmium efflux system membrane fusion protein
MIVRQGEAIFVPQGSPYRDRIHVAPVDVNTIRPMRVLPASIEVDPTKAVNVLPPVTGRIIDLKVRLGDEVKQGQTLAVIGSGDFAQAFTDVDKARASVELTRRAYERAKGLKQFGGGAQKDVDQAESDHTQAQAELNRAETRLKQIGGTISDSTGTQVLPITSPTNGIVTSIATATGAYANDLTATIMTITDLATVWVTANVPENDLAFVSKNQSVDITMLAYPGQVFHGKVAIVSQVLEPDTRRAKVRIVFPNPDGKLKPNMFANVTFFAPQKEAIGVPTSALLMNNDSTTVFVETKPWTFERRTVEPEADINGVAPIRVGLTAGERVVTRGGVLLND